MKFRMLLAISAMLIATSSNAGGSRLGVSKCGDWLNARVSGRSTNSAHMEFWLLGYLSGISIVTGKDFLTQTNSTSIEAWMDNYCRSNPLESLGVGGDSLATELMRRMRQ